MLGRGGKVTGGRGREEKGGKPICGRETAIDILIMSCSSPPCGEGNYVDFSRYHLWGAVGCGDGGGWGLKPCCCGADVQLHEVREGIWSFMLKPNTHNSDHNEHTGKGCQEL